MGLFRDNNGYSREWVVPTGIGATIIALIALMAAAFGVWGNHDDHVSCLRLHEQTGLETKYARSGVNGECYVKVGGQWVPEDRWRNISD